MLTRPNQRNLFMPRLITSLWIIPVLMTAAHVAHADKIDDAIKRQMQIQHIPGLALAVVHNGKIIKARGYGFASLELHVPVTSETIFQSGSLGKQFTATLVMMLAHDKIFSLDDPITRWFPEQTDIWKGVTIRHLLSHTSGLPDLPDETMDKRKNYTEDELVRLIAEQPPVKPPGTEWRYNNGGYVLLGFLIHRATGKFYGDLLKTKIFRPLGMKTAKIINEQDIVPNRAAGYRWTAQGIKNQKWKSPDLNTTADGGLYLTVLDYIQWDAGLYTSKLLPFNELKQTWTPARFSNGKLAVSPTYYYGFGWTIPFNAHGHHLIEHQGANQGFSTYIGRVLDQKTTVIVLANLDGGHCSPAKIGRLVFQQYVSDLPDFDGE